MPWERTKGLLLILICQRARAAIAGEKDFIIHLLPPPGNKPG